MKWKRLLLVMLAVFSLNVSTMACFYDDPSANVGTERVAQGGGSGGGAWFGDYEFDSGWRELPGMSIDWDKIVNEFYEKWQITLNTAQSFPMTLYTEFSGFADNSKVTRACLMYLNQQGYWVILKDIKNPKWEITTNTGRTRALFGKNSIPSAMGHRFGEVLTIRTYYASDTQQTFDLEEALSTKVTDRSTLSNVINILVHSNTSPE